MPGTGTALQTCPVAADDTQVGTGSAWDDPRSRAHVAGLWRAARWCAALALVAALAAAAAGALAQARADRLLRDGTPTTAVVVAQEQRAKAHAVRLALPGGTVVDLRVAGTWSDPYAGYPVGARVPVWHTPGDPYDLRTARDWGTPGHVLALGVAGTALLLVLAPTAGAVTVVARRRRRRFEDGRWAPTVPVTAPGLDGTTTATVDDGQGAPVVLPDTLWPWPAVVEVLHEAPRRSVLALVPPGAGRTTPLVVPLRRRAGAGSARRGRADG